MSDPQGVQILKGGLYGGASPPGYTLTAVPGDEGLMLASRTQEKPRKHLVRVAEGADPVLAICLMYSFFLADDELQAGSN